MSKRYTGHGRHRVTRRGRSYYLGRRIGNPDWKIVGFAALVGVAGTVGAMYLQSRNIPFLQQHWWAMPAVIAGGGAVLMSKMPVVGVGLVVIAGALGYTGYVAASGKPAAGFSEAGAFYGVRRDSGVYEGMGALVGAGGRRAAFHQGAVGGAGALLGRRAMSTTFNQGAVGALAGYGSAGALGLD